MRKIISTKLCPILSNKIFSQSIEQLPVIVQFKNPNYSFNERISAMTVGPSFELPLINGLAADMSTKTIYEIISKPEIEYISFDSKVHSLLDIATPVTEAYFPHERGYDGRGVTIAIIDTGIAQHNDLMKPENRIIGFKDLINSQEIPYDDNGHGSHVAGIIGGNGYSSSSKYVGIAPKSNILAIKALDKNGGGSTSKIIEAISFVIETRGTYNTKIVNLSIGSSVNSPCNKDPLCKAIGKAVELGLTMVVAAGNSGPNRGTILSPGNSPNAITVGAIDDKRTIDISDDTVADFSSRGPTREGVTKPDLLAPGVNINSLSNTNLDGYISLSGTSMATPLVSGAVALMLNKYPDMQPSEIKKRLLNSCVDMKESKNFQGAGMLNLRLLFNDKEDDKKDVPEPADFDKSVLENLFILLMVIFLLDSRL